MKVPFSPARDTEKGRTAAKEGCHDVAGLLDLTAKREATGRIFRAIDAIL